MSQFFQNASSASGVVDSITGTNGCILTAGFNYYWTAGQVIYFIVSCAASTTLQYAIVSGYRIS